MARHIFATLVLVILVQVTLAFECPQNLGIFADQNSPSHYYMCVNFVPFRQQCPETLNFDKKFKQCKLDSNYVLTHKGTTKHKIRSTTRLPKPSNPPKTTRRRRRTTLKHKSSHRPRTSPRLSTTRRRRTTLKHNSSRRPRTSPRVINTSRRRRTTLKHTTKKPKTTKSDYYYYY